MSCDGRFIPWGANDPLAHASGDPLHDRVLPCILEFGAEVAGSLATTDRFAREEHVQNLLTCTRACPPGGRGRQADTPTATARAHTLLARPGLMAGEVTKKREDRREGRARVATKGERTCCHHLHTHISPARPGLSPGEGISQQGRGGRRRGCSRTGGRTCCHHSRTRFSCKSSASARRARLLRRTTRDAADTAATLAASLSRSACACPHPHGPWSESRMCAHCRAG